MALRRCPDSAIRHHIRVSKLNRIPETVSKKNAFDMTGKQPPSLVCQYVQVCLKTPIPDNPAQCPMPESSTEPPSPPPPAKKSNLASPKSCATAAPSTSPPSSSAPP